MILLMMVDTPEEKRKFVILYENYRYLMLKVAVDILHDYQLAEDAVQEAFVRVAKHMENVGQPEETAAKRYLITITKHAAIDLYRRRNRLQSREIYMDELPEETGQLTYMAPEEEHGVLDILKNLPPKYRDIFLLKYSAHLENREIARICGLREGTIRQKAYEAADTERKVYAGRKTVEENHTENCGSSICDACGSTHRHDECGGLPGTFFSYGKNGAGW